MSLKVCENVVRVSNSLDLDETLSNSASHPDPSCLHMALIVVSSGLRINILLSDGKFEAKQLDYISR